MLMKQIIFCIISVLLVSNYSFSHRFRSKSHNKVKRIEKGKGVTTTTTSSSSNSDSPFGENKACELFKKPDHEKFEESGNTVYGRRQNDVQINISNGPASYVFDAINKHFDAKIGTEFEAVMKMLTDSSSKKGQNRLINADNDLVSSTKKTEGEANKLFVFDNLKGALTAGNYNQKYQGDSAAMALLKKFSDDGIFLTYKQALRAMIEAILPDDPRLKCTNCLAETRKLAAQLFRFVDCLNLGETTSRQLFETLGEIDTNNVKVSSTATNDFILKNGNMGNGIVNRNGWVKAILVGFWERKVGKDSIDDHYKTLMKYRENK